jgi:hypothetical protein
MVWSSYGRPLLKEESSLKRLKCGQHTQSVSQCKQPSTTIDLRLSMISTLFWFVCSRPQTPTALRSPVPNTYLVPTTSSYSTLSCFLVPTPHAHSCPAQIHLFNSGSDDIIGFIQGGRWYCDLQVSSLVVDDTTRCLVWTSKFAGK